MLNQRIICLIVALATGATVTKTIAAEPAVLKYGERNAEAPSELSLFSFFVGTWKGGGRTRLPDGKYAQYDDGVTWIGRYVLDGMAIADEVHIVNPEGKPYLGITLRQFDAKRASWIIEFLNVTVSFVRRQVNPRSGSVSVKDGTITIISEDGESRIRENYRVADEDHFSYSTELSRDGGRSWDPPAFEMTLVRVE